MVSMLTWILFVRSASEPTCKLKLNVLATFACATLILKEPSPLSKARSVSSPFFTDAWPSVSPILFAASSSLPASSYAFCFVMSVTSLSSTPSAAPATSVIAVADSVPTLTVTPPFT